LTQKLLLQPAFSPQIVDGEGVYLLSERGHFLLRGALYCQLAPLLDGRYSADEIVGRLAGEAAPAEVHYALARLKRNGYVVAADGDAPPDRVAFWNGLGLDPWGVERHLQERTVALAGFGAVSLHSISHALTALDVRLGADGDFTVALTDDYLQGGLDDLNAAALRAGRPWLLVKPVGTVLWIGPVFRPGQTACWQCLAERLRANRRVEAYLQSRKGSAAPLHADGANLTAGEETAVQLAAIETIKAIGPPAEGQEPEAELTTLDLGTLEMQRHRVVRRPQCYRCGDPARWAVRTAVPVALRSQRKRFTSDGGHRTVPPEQTLANYDHHVSPITGAVTLLRRVSLDDDDLIHFYVAAHASPRSADDLTTLNHILQEVSGGKGMTDAQARASALCEALERYSGCSWGGEASTMASYRRLGARAIHPNACMLFSESQYRWRREWNARGSKHEYVPAPIDEDAEIPWTAVSSLATGELRYLPTEYCYGYFRDGPQPGPRYCLSDSNGNAAGNTLEEAILQGFMELVERDSVALWWYSRARRPEVDLDSVGNPHVQQLRRHYRGLDRELWLLDLTTDLGIPCFAAISRRVDKAEEDIIWGFGAHFDASVGILRALTELNQNLPRILHDGDAKGHAEDRRIRDWHRSARLADHPYLAPDGTAPRAASDYDRAWSDDLREDVLRCQEVAERAGMELLVLDQTRPEIGLPVVKVIVPGLRHFRPRLAPGRLYDVPLRLGWIGQPLTEDQLNPVPYFFP
jgi:oxazoline/thiazoline synthase